MALRQFLSCGAVLLAFATSVGCGRGLSVDLSSNPPAPVPGSPYELTLTVGNDSQCDLAEDVDIPLIGPGGFSGLAFIIGFDPTLGMDPAAICRALQACTDEECLGTLTESALGARVVDEFRVAAQELSESRTSGAALSGLPMDECIEADNDDELGVLGVCGIGLLGPGDSQTLMLTGITPDTGNRTGAQFAFAVAGARGPDCGPGVEIEPGEWQLGGCFPLEALEPVPAVSTAGLAALLAGLLVAGSLALRRIRQS